MLLEKTHRSPTDFARLMQLFQRRISLIPAEELLPHMDNARLQCPDANDLPYFALALKLGAGIWSNDARLSQQTAVRVWTTSELARRLRL